MACGGSSPSIPANFNKKVLDIRTFFVYIWCMKCDNKQCGAYNKLYTNNCQIGYTPEYCDVYKIYKLKDENSKLKKELLVLKTNKALKEGFMKSIKNQIHIIEMAIKDLSEIKKGYTNLTGSRYMMLGLIRTMLHLHDKILLSESVDKYSMTITETKLKPHFFWWKEPTETIEKRLEHPLETIIRISEELVEELKKENK